MWKFEKIEFSIHNYFFYVVTINKSLPDQSTYRHVFYFLLSHPHCVLHLKHLLLYSMCVCEWLPIFPFPWLNSALDKMYNKMRIFVAMHAVFLLNIILLSEWELPQQTYSKVWLTYLYINSKDRWTRSGTHQQLSRTLRLESNSLGIWRQREQQSHLSWNRRGWSVF